MPSPNLKGEERFMRSLQLFCLPLVVAIVFGGCRSERDVEQDDGSDTGHVSTAPGGFGSGPTGTGGNQPADNPAAGAQGAEGTDGL